ncbi:hypothetical protein DL96DRAFT_1580159 [Flagelloscypha sp. PMI_526]|nr:hypothetical protein DL96DRAFT_1580159 [Flagelloscypha sp. PMI_526]
MPSANKTIRGGIRVLLFDGEHSTRSGVISPLETLRIVMHRIAYDTAGIESDGSASEGSTETNSIQPTEALPCNYFDFIIGSGDGGWVATMLGRLGMSVSQTIEAYQRIHSELHHSNQSLSTKERTSRFKDMLKELVKSHSVSSNTEESFRITSKDMRCRTILLAMTSQSIGSPTLIRSYNSREFPFENCTTVAAILAATAVPGLFEPWKIGYQKFIAANQWGHCNPLSATLSEVKTVFPNDSLFCILSLGSGHPGHNSLPEAETPAITATALRLAKDAEAGAQQAQSQLNTKEKILFRFNVEQGLQEYVKADKEGYDDAFCHTQAYCQHPEVTAAIDAAVKRLLQSTADEPCPPKVS